MRKTYHYISVIVLALALAAPHVLAQEFEHKQIIVRLGYNIGGTAPLGLPATIRHLNSYTPQMSPALGLDVLFPFDGWRGVLTGLRMERKAMSEDDNVKNYHMEITRGGETLAGVFTGDVTTKTHQWLLTVPVQAVWRVKKVNIKLGPYASWVISKGFSGWAHNGYLRVDDPTGAKVVLGEEEGERGDYDFSDNLRNWQVGLGLGADWQFNRRMGLYADLNWGFTGAFRNDFRTIEQTLFPIYGQMGFIFRLR